MNESSILVAYFGLPLVFVIALYLMRQQSKTKAAAEIYSEAEAAGLTEPASLHPDIDPNLCLGCGACATACPEGKIIGLMHRKAVLVSPTSCIGHGACKEACPADAISLVFGTEKRGVEIPMVSSDFETTVPGIYIAGELGGMGLIRNAIAQGTQAVEAIVRRKSDAKCDLDLVIVGAGPAGLSAALMAQDKKLRYVVLEQDTAGGTVAHYPRGKIVMTAPAELPIIGKFQFREASKEALVEFWGKAMAKGELKINSSESVTDIQQKGGGFLVVTPKAEYSTKSVLLCMGRRGTPRKLGVEGEDQSKVVYRLIDPDQYRGQHVLVVGGGDSALEAALATAEGGAASTTLAYRSEAFSRAKPKNRKRVEEAAANGSMRVMMSTVTKSIGEKDVVMKGGDEETTLPNDAVIVCAGGILPTPFLKKIGVEVEEKFGTA